MNTIEITDIGTMPYAEVLQLQEAFFDKNIDAKTQGQPTHNRVILCEHNPVYTLGKSGKRENFLVNGSDLNAGVFQVNRGGDVTYHGPGQLVAYPLLDLDTLKIGVAQYIQQLEETIIATLATYGINSERLAGAPGIWIDADKPTARKIAAIGARVSRHITMHGLAINVNTDLSRFDKIVSCGIKDKGVTSLQRELGGAVAMEEFKGHFIQHFLQVFKVERVKVKE